MVAPFIVSLLISIAISIVSYMIQPKPKAPKPEAAKDMEGPTSEAGREIPVVFGTGMVKSPNCLWFGDKSQRTYQVNS